MKSRSGSPSVRTTVLLASLVAAYLLTAPEARRANPPADLPGLLNDGLSHPPPFDGAFGFNTFVPPNVVGQTYVDPVFGSTVRRLTTDHQPDDIYARNMWWNADGTKYVHRNQVIDTATGLVTHIVSVGTVTTESGFDPVDPNVYYYYNQNTIHRVVLSTTSSAITDTVYFTAPSAIRSLGGTVNWMDASGRYMLVRYGAAEPTMYVYDRLNMAAGPYAGALDASATIEQGGYVGLTPSGQFLVGYDNLTGQRGVSWRIDHAARAILAPNYFWSLCGDHGSFTSASDGRDYMVVAACHDVPEVWRVDITNNAVGLNEAQQKALPNNQRLIAWPTWDDEVHFASVARGPFRDWAFVSTGDQTDVFGSGTNAGGLVAPWRPYKQEIVAMNVITGEIRRVAHHRSRSIGLDAASQPRVSVSWGGEFVGWSTNFNQPGVTDVFAVPFALAAPAITDVTAMNVTNSTASILWTTDQLSTSRVDYGPTTAYGTSTALDTTQTTAHVQALTGLTQGTTYHYRVISTNVRSLTSTSPDATFVASQPPAISGISATPAPFSATITWTTDQPADTQIIYGPTTAYGSTTALDGAQTTGHSQTLLNLSHSTPYHFRVRSRNAHGLLTTSADGTFTTAPGVLVSNLTISNIQGAAAAFYWSTDQPADTQIEYGLTTAYGSMTALSPPLILNHGQAVNSGLQPGTTYQFRVRSKNAAGVLGTSAGSFTTAPATVISNVAVGSLAGTTATITWTTDLPASSRIEYGVTNYTSSTTLDPALVTSHNHTITGLTPGVTYVYLVRSITGQNTLTKVGGFSVTTLSTPVISNVTATNVTGGSATIAWTTNSPSDSQVEYGPTTAYGSTTAVDPATVTTHAAALTGLTGGPAYHYRVRSTNVVGSATSPDFAFTMATSPIVSAVVVSNITGATATVSWITDQPSTSVIDYGPTSAYGSTTREPRSTLIFEENFTSDNSLNGQTAPTQTQLYDRGWRDGVGDVGTGYKFEIDPALNKNVMYAHWSTATGERSEPDGGASAIKKFFPESRDVTMYALVKFHNVENSPNGAHWIRFFNNPSAGDFSPANMDGQMDLDVSGLDKRDWLYDPTTKTPLPEGGVPQQSKGFFLYTGGPSFATAGKSNVYHDDVWYEIVWYLKASTIPGDATTNSDGQMRVYLRPLGTTPWTTVFNGANFVNSALTSPISAWMIGPYMDRWTADIRHYFSRVVMWSGDAYADGTLADFVGTPPTGSIGAPTLVTTHGKVITGLTSTTLYHYRVRSMNAAGLETASADATFTTTFNVTNLTISDIQGNAAAIYWSTDRPADTQIEYGTTTAYGSLTALSTPLILNHGQAINTGLQPATTYFFRVRSKNVNGVLGTATGTFRTAPAAVISNVAVANVTGTTATITWNTDLPASSRIEYGVANYTSITTLDPALVTSHSHTITGLTPGVTYLYMVRSITGQNTLTKIGGFSVTTLLPPAVSSVAASNVSATSATITWTTNLPLDSQVDYGPTTAYGSSTIVNPSAVTAHAVTLNGLSALTTYHYRVRSANSAGSTTSGDFTFSTVAPLPPVVSNITISNIQGQAAAIYWATDQPADTQIEYGLTTNYGSTTALNLTLMLSHGQAINSGLQPATTYHFRIRARNAAGLLGTSTDRSFTTAPATVISNVVVASVTGTTATITWTTDLPANSRIDYGVTNYTSTTMLDPALVTSHSHTITGLTPGTTYIFMVRSITGQNTLTKVGGFSFTTAAPPPQ